MSANTKALEKIIAALAEKGATVRVGIPAGSTRSDGHTNAQVGAWHEFGTSKMPVRSFLRMPIENHLAPAVEKADVLNKKQIANIIKTKSLTGVMTHLGIVAETVVQDAFDTGGFGEWIPSDFSRKQNHETLVETAQLRRAVTSEVIE